MLLSRYPGSEHQLAEEHLGQFNLEIALKFIGVLARVAAKIQAQFQLILKRLKVPR